MQLADVVEIGPPGLAIVGGYGEGEGYILIIGWCNIYLAGLDGFHQYDFDTQLRSLKRIKLVK